MLWRERGVKSDSDIISFYFYFIGLSNGVIGDAISEILKAEERAVWGNQEPGLGLVTF